MPFGPYTLCPDKLAASIPMPDLRRKPAADSPLAEVRLFAAGGTDAVAAAAEAEGNGLARWLTALPPNVLGPHAYRVLLEALANREGWTADFLGTAELEKSGAGAFRARPLIGRRACPSPSALCAAVHGRWHRVHASSCGAHPPALLRLSGG